jgi:hypothetical protein
MARKLTGHPRSVPKVVLDRLLDQPGDVVRTVKRVLR